MKRLAIAAVGLALVVGVVAGGMVGNPFGGKASASATGVGGRLISLGTQTSTAASATTVVPTAESTQAPQPTSQPTPSEEGIDESVALLEGCNPVVSTYPDNTPIGTVADAVAPAESVMALWAFEAGVWVGYSPQFPDVGDLRALDRLDVVFICVDAAATLPRWPI